MGNNVSSFHSYDALVAKLIADRAIETQRIQKAFQAVNRGHFQPYPTDDEQGPYEDVPWRDGSLHISAPSIYGYVLEALELEQGVSFLNLGSGTGYLSTIVGLLIGPHGINHGVEINRNVVDYANKCVYNFKNKKMPFLDDFDFVDPTFVHGDLMQLYPDTPKYDRIYVGAHVFHSQANYIKQLVKMNGIVVMPTGGRLMKLTRIGEEVDDFVRVEIARANFSDIITDYPFNAPVELPAVEPPTLQELCRSSVRHVIRTAIKSNEPDPPIIPIEEEEEEEELNDDNQKDVELYQNLFQERAESMDSDSEHSDLNPEEDGEDDVGGMDTEMAENLVASIPEFGGIQVFERPRRQAIDFSGFTDQLLIPPECNEDVNGEVDSAFRQNIKQLALPDLIIKYLTYENE